MKQRLLTLADSRLYCVTAGPGTKGHEETTKACCQGGVDILQLREKALSVKELIELAKRLKAICDKYGVLFLVSDRPDVALAVEAHGVHLGQNDLPIAVARKILGHGRLIGASAHSLREALEAQSAGADYISCGPLWATPTKPDYKPVGLSLIGQYKKAIRIPFFAIGGIDTRNVTEVLAVGAERIAAVRALWNAPDPRFAAEEFKRKIENKDAIPEEAVL